MWKFKENFLKFPKFWLKIKNFKNFDKELLLRKISKIKGNLLKILKFVLNCIIYYQKIEVFKKMTLIVKDYPLLIIIFTLKGGRDNQSIIIREGMKKIITDNRPISIKYWNNKYEWERVCVMCTLFFKNRFMYCVVWFLPYLYIFL